MDEKVKKEEISHLTGVVKAVKSAKTALEAKLAEIGEGNLDQLKDLRADPETGTDFELMLDMLNEKNQTFNLKDKFTRLEEYEYLSKNPYFARIDVSGKTNSKLSDHKIYIGKFGYTAGDTPVITDWRASIASVYYRYRYPQKDVEYNTPNGKEHADLKLKRTFDLHDGKLVKYYNNDIQFDENDIIVGKIEQRTGGVLEDIIETIQQDQMEIIESDPRQVCIVQGCVGSGKSTVAIHKLAHIFFHFGNYIHPERSILVVKNQILIGYLSTLFPKLGIFDINFKTLRDLIIHALFREELGVKIDLDVEENTLSFGLDKIQQLYKHVDSIHKMYKEKLAAIFADPDVESFGGYKYSENLTPYANMDEILDDLKEECDAQAELLKENPKSIRALFYKDNIRSMKKIIRTVNDLKYKLKREILADVLRSHGVNPTEKLNYVQTLVYILIYSKLIGFSKVFQYEYCVIDEGQDFSLLEFAVLGQFVLRGRFGIFGDLNQSLNSDGISQWDQIKEVIPEVKKAQVFSLGTNYRSTKPIIDYANVFISKFTDKYLPVSVNRNGVSPHDEQLASAGEIIDTFNNMVGRDLAELNKSVGVICFDDTLMAETERVLTGLKLGKTPLIKLDKTKRINYLPRGVYYMHANDCKGLEFSKVYVLGLNLAKIKEPAEARKAFVAITRAMNELVVLGIK
jgi:DNA helicase II / ATP-dependent DNA helicase PcrA